MVDVKTVKQTRENVSFKVGIGSLGNVSCEKHIVSQLTILSIMTNDNMIFVFMFLKFKFPLFMGIEYEDAYDFLLHCHELIHKINIKDRFGVEFLTY